MDLYFTYTVQRNYIKAFEKKVVMMQDTLQSVDNSNACKPQMFKLINILLAILMN